MEIRHLRYFIAVAEEGSFFNAAERRLHTSQPSLSRQIRDLELEIGARLLERNARGITLTPAGQVFLDHARLVLMQVEAAGEAARRAAKPVKREFVIGFLAGQEVVWLAETLRILREEAPEIDVTISSLSSPELASGLMQGKIDVALLRHEASAPGIAFKFLMKEPFVVILPKDHRLASAKEIRPRDLARERFIAGSTKLAPVLRPIVKAYADRMGLPLNQSFDVENLSGGMSLIASSGSVALLPFYVTNILIPSVVARPLAGEPLTVDLMIGWSKSNTSPLLKRFVDRSEELATGIGQRTRGRQIRKRQ
jgi:LysR family transcriptional regulator, hca operon transcriptional activator